MPDLSALAAWIKHPRHAAAVIFLVALALRVAVALHLPDRIVWYDGTRYMRVADNLLQQHSFGSLRDNRYSVPTLPALLAGLRLVFGDSLVALRLCFALMGALTCVIGYFLSLRLFGPTTALIAGAGLALYPHYIYLSALFEYPQTLFVLTTGVTFLAYFQFLGAHRRSALITCGVMLGLDVLTVPTVLPFVPLLLACLLFMERGRWRIQAPLVVLLATALVIGSWTTRNYLQYGDLILVNRGGGFAFWTANNETYYQLGKKAVTPPCAPGYTTVSFCLELRALQTRLHAEGRPENESITLNDRAQWENGMRFIRESWSRTAALSLRKFLQFWDPRPDAVSNTESYGGAARWIAILSYTPVLVLGVIGIALSRGRWRELLPVYAYFAVFTGMYSVFLPTTRYRLPLDFFLVIFSAYALTTLWGRWTAPVPMDLTSGADRRDNNYTSGSRI